MIYVPLAVQVMFGVGVTVRVCSRDNSIYLQYEIILRFLVVIFVVKVSERVAMVMMNDE